MNWKEYRLYARAPAVSSATVQRIVRIGEACITNVGAMTGNGAKVSAMQTYAHNYVKYKFSRGNLLLLTFVDLNLVNFCQYS